MPMDSVIICSHSCSTEFFLFGWRGVNVLVLLVFMKATRYITAAAENCLLYGILLHKRTVGLQFSLVDSATSVRCSLSQLTNSPELVLAQTPFYRYLGVRAKEST